MPKQEESTPRRPRRSRADGELSRVRILDAASEIAAERGYEGTSIALVSAKCGLPASSIYWHFTDKDTLLAEVISDSYVRWRAIQPTWAKSPAGDDLKASIDAVLMQMSEGIVGQPEFWRLGIMLAMEHRVTEAEARVRFREVRGDTLALLTSWWARALPGEHLTAVPDAAFAMARMTLAFGDGLFIATQIDSDVNVDRFVSLLSVALEAIARHVLAGKERQQR
jgi:AcrR family transcriptional regulator